VSDRRGHSQAGRDTLLKLRCAFPDPPLAAAGIVLRRPAADDIPWITAACSDRELSRYVPVIPYPRWLPAVAVLLCYLGAELAAVRRRWLDVQRHLCRGYGSSSDDVAGGCPLRVAVARQLPPDWAEA